MTERLSREEVNERLALLDSMRKHGGLSPEAICHDQALETARQLYEEIEQLRARATPQYIDVDIIGAGLTGWSEGALRAEVAGKEGTDAHV